VLALWLKSYKAEWIIEKQSAAAERFTAVPGGCGFGTVAELVSYACNGFILKTEQKVWFRETRPEHVLVDVPGSAVTMLIGKIQHEGDGAFTAKAGCVPLHIAV